MRTTMRRLGLVPALLALATPSAAGDFDGSKDLVCVSQEAIECMSALGCERVTPDALGIPNFVAVDFGKKRLRDATGASERTTTIQSVRKVDGKTILQGAETGRGWSLVIDQRNGRMTATSSGVDDAGERFGFILFGACKKD